MTWGQSVVLIFESIVESNATSLSIMASTRIVSGKIAFDQDCDQHQYLISTSKTAFSMSFLERFEAELVWPSFNQRVLFIIFTTQVMKKTSADIGATSALVVNWG